MKCFLFMMTIMGTSISFADSSLNDFAVEYNSIEPVLPDQNHDVAFKRSLNLFLIENSQSEGYSDLLEKYKFTGDMFWTNWGQVLKRGYVISMRLQGFNSVLDTVVVTIDLNMHYKPGTGVLTIDRKSVTRIK